MARYSLGCIGTLFVLILIFSLVVTLVIRWHFLLVVGLILILFSIYLFNLLLKKIYKGENSKPGLVWKFMCFCEDYFNFFLTVSIVGSAIPTFLYVFYALDDSSNYDNLDEFLEFLVIRVIIGILLSFIGYGIYYVINFINNEGGIKSVLKKNGTIENVSITKRNIWKYIAVISIIIAVITISFNISNFYKDKKIDQYIDDLGSSQAFVRSTAITELANIGEPVVPKLVEAMKNSSYDVRFGAADALVKMGKVNVLDNIITNSLGQDLGRIAESYPYYIRKGNHGTESVLVRALNAYGTVAMAEDYLNCGNDILENGAEKWAKDNGYIVTKKPGVHNGPIWGQNM